jgi:hypothetical protein
MLKKSLKSMSSTNQSSKLKQLKNILMDGNLLKSLRMLGLIQDILLMAIADPVLNDGRKSTLKKVKKL